MATISTLDVEDLSAFGNKQTAPPAATKVAKAAVAGVSAPKATNGKVFDLKAGTINVGGKNLSTEQTAEKIAALRKMGNSPENRNKFNNPYTKAANTYEKILDSFHKEKNSLKVSNMKLEGESIVYNGKKYSLRDKQQLQNLWAKVKETTEFGDDGVDKFKSLKKQLYNRTPADKRKGLPL